MNFNYRWVTAACIGIALTLSHDVLGSSKNLQLSEVEKLNRCYNRFVNKPLQTSGTSLGAKLYVEVRDKKKTGSAACLALLEYAALNSSGILTNSTSEEAQAIVQTFHHLHNSFFKVNALNYSSNYHAMTLMMRDLDEPALYYTQALFGGKSVSNAVTAKESLRSIRTSNLKKENYKSRYMNPHHQGSYPASMVDVPRLTVYDGDTTKYPEKEKYARDIITAGFKTLIAEAEATKDTAKLNSIKNSTNSGVNAYRIVKSFNLTDAQIIGQGALIGIQAQKALTVPIPPIASYAGVKLNNSGDASHNLYAHPGGGILGTPMYQIKNTNLGANVPTGGAGMDPWATVPRRFTSRLYEDLLCHILPTLKAADVTADVDAKSSHGFRNSATCMACHSSFDPLAGAFRNRVVGITSASQNSEIHTQPARSVGSPILTVREYKPDASVTNIKTYALQTPTGRLMYRDHSGSLIKQTAGSVAQLGQFIADSDDFYRCVAKRYYHFLTGIDVNLYAQDTDLDAVGKKHKKLVFQMGRILKGAQYADKNEETTYKNYKQSLKMLVKFIVDSDSFSRRDLGLMGE